MPTNDLAQPLLRKTAAPFKVSGTPPLKVLLNPIAWILWVLDFLCWLISILGPIKWLLSCCDRRSHGKQVEGGVWRNAPTADRLVSISDPACTTVHDLFQKACATHASGQACGTRTYVGTHKPEGSRFPLAVFGKTTWLTYKEFGQRAKNFGSGLIGLGLVPAPPNTDLQKTAAPHSILIFEETCVDWATALLGSFSQSLTVATSYHTLGMSAVADAINETNARAIVCNINDVEKISKYCQGKCPSLAHIIYTLNNSTEKELKATVTGHQAHSMQQVINLGANHPHPFTAPTPKHVAVIMYTSGSTGKPKGVMITHGNMVASIAAMNLKFIDLGLVPGKEVYLAYLPAAHILELIAELTNFANGSAVGFADPRTISSKGACRQLPDGTLNFSAGGQYPPGAIQEFRPTLMAAVPKIWDILKKGAEESIGKGSAVKKFLFQVAYSGRYWAVSQGRESPLFKALVFSKLKAMLGGRIKIGLTGGGPISAEVHNFIRVSLAMPLLQGYALTETTCAGSVQMLDDARTGVVGPPLASVEIKLRPCVNDKGEPEILDRKMNPYLPTDKKHYDSACAGRGEVMIRGPSVSIGYFKQPDKTAQEFDKEGWFHTGDVGVFTTNGALMIVDRVKNLVKLKGGEYIAIEAMEKEYGTSVYVNPANGGILCYGDGDMDRPVAIIQANVKELEAWAKAAGVTYSGVEDLCKMPATEKMVLDNLVLIGKEAGLGANEILGAVALIPGTGPTTGTLTPESPWTPENAGLTASNKLNRQPIQTGLSKILKPLKEKGIR